jgi:hypothetical protein
LPNQSSVKEDLIPVSNYDTLYIKKEPVFKLLILGAIFSLKLNGFADDYNIY